MHFVLVYGMWIVRKYFRVDFGHLGRPRCCIGCGRKRILLPPRGALTELHPKRLQMSERSRPGLRASLKRTRSGATSPALHCLVSLPRTYSKMVSCLVSRRRNSLDFRSGAEVGGKGLWNYLVMRPARSFATWIGLIFIDALWMSQLVNG